MTETINWQDLDLTTIGGRLSLNHVIARLTGEENEFTPSWGHPPQYCTDLNDAIQLQHDGWLLQLKHWTRADDKDEWLATYYNNQQARGIGRFHEFPAMAICLAWLDVSEKQ